MTADLPGFDRSEVDVRVTDRTLQVSADRSEDHREREGEFLTRERRHGTAKRSITLPVAVDREGISARYRDGVLTVRMPNREPATRGVRVEVE